MKAFLILEDGTVYEGENIGSSKEIISEIIFHTSMGGYLEIMTDPASAGQAVAMTYPLIGNYGVTPDGESEKVWADGIIVKEIARRASNFRCQGELEEYLVEKDVTGICGIDTRALTKRLREKGSMKGMITTAQHFDLKEAVEKIKAYNGKKVLYEASGNQTTYILGDGPKVAVLNLGSKEAIVNALKKRNCELCIYPASTDMDVIMNQKFDGIVISNGPGSPDDYPELVEQIRKLSQNQIPVFGIGLGHLMIAASQGASIVKMKHAHHGGNYPVKDLRDGRVYISSQGHGYTVDSINSWAAEPLFENVNDGTNEGLIYKEKPMMSVTFQPETGTGQIDLGFVYDQFMKMMKGEQ